MAKTKARSKRATTVKYQLSDIHPNHDRHLCHIVALRNMKAAGRLSEGARYLCGVCGRAAKKQANLCVPVEI
jgi:hypothetical protein